jgi:hypothetical protein
MAFLQCTPFAILYGSALLLALTVVRSAKGF